MSGISELKSQLLCKVRNHLLSYIGVNSNSDHSFTILHFGAELALLSVLKQRLMVLDIVPCLAARLVKQSAIPTRCRALKNTEKGDVSSWLDTHHDDMQDMFALIHSFKNEVSKCWMGTEGKRGDHERR